MKVLSTRLAMRDGYLPEQFRHTIVEWLKAGPPSKEVGERYEIEEITTKPTILKAGFCTLETFILKRPDATYEACKLTHIYREQTWVAEAILKTTPQSESKVYINIDCLGDTTGFDEIPTVRTEIIRAFVKDGWLREDILPISAEPIMLTGAEVNVVVDAINGSYRGSLPLVFVSKYFDSAGHEVDVQWLAKDLAGIGIVVAEQDDNYLDELKERTNRQNPFNGHIGIYFPHSRNARVYRPSDWRRYGSVNATIIKEVASYLDTYQRRGTVSKVTLDNVRRILSTFFSWLEDEDYIIKSPVRRIHKVKTGKTVKETYSDESLELMRDHCDNLRDLALIDLLASTGIRVGELVKLNRTDVDFENRECVVFGKGNKQRKVYFDARTKIHLQKYLAERTDDHDALFVSLLKPNSRLQISGVEIRLRKIGRELSMQKVHPHKFRRTLATMAIDKGMPIEQVQHLLGHQSIDTTLQYAMVNQANVKTSCKRFIG